MNAYEQSVSAAEPFFVLEDVIRAARNAISECRKRAEECKAVGDRAGRAKHLDRALWYRRRLVLWELEQNMETDV